MAKFKIKDINGNVLNTIVASASFVEANYEHYEEVQPEAPSEDLAIKERIWRDSELVRTDALAILPDYPNATALTTYRQALRDWPASESFPDTRPTLGA